MWGTVSSLLTDSESLKRDLEAMIERERKSHSDPEPEAKAWAATLLEVERKRDKYQEMFAADALTLDEVRAKSDALEGTREADRRGLAAPSGSRESLRTPERDEGRIPGFHAAMVSGPLPGLDLGERRTVYSVSKPCVQARSHHPFAARRQRRIRLGKAECEDVLPHGQTIRVFS